MLELSSLSFAKRHLSCIHQLKRIKILTLKLTRIVLKQKFKEKFEFSRCAYYFSPCNLHSRHFSTHPPTLICISCKLEKPYAKMDHPLQETVLRANLPEDQKIENLEYLPERHIYRITSALIVLSHNDRGVVPLIVKDKIGLISREPVEIGPKLKKQELWF